MKVLLNGRETELSDGATVEAALDALSLPGGGRGVAVAVDAEVVPRGEWPEHELQEGARVSYDEEAGDKGPKAVNVQTL